MEIDKIKIMATPLMGIQWHTFRSFQIVFPFLIRGSEHIKKSSLASPAGAIDFKIRDVHKATDKLYQSIPLST